MVTNTRMRPRFRLTIDAEPEKVLGSLRRSLRQADPVIAGNVFSTTAILWLHREKRRFYSPCVHIHFDDERDDGQVILHGRFAPHPNIWTAFMAGYGVWSLGAIAALVYGFVQWNLGWTPWALLGFPAACAMIGFEYGAAFIGQGLGAEQMYQLRSFVDRTLDGLGITSVELDAVEAPLSVPPPGAAEGDAGDEAGADDAEAPSAG